MYTYGGHMNSAHRCEFISLSNPVSVKRLFWSSLARVLTVHLLSIIRGVGMSGGLKVVSDWSDIMSEPK